jgi:hypothetical protein
LKDGAHQGIISLYGGSEANRTEAIKFELNANQKKLFEGQNARH